MLYVLKVFTMTYHTKDASNIKRKLL